MLLDALLLREFESALFSSCSVLENFELEIQFLEIENLKEFV